MLNPTTKSRQVPPLAPAQLNWIVTLPPTGALAGLTEVIVKEVKLDWASARGVARRHTISNGTAIQRHKRATEKILFEKILRSCTCDLFKF